MLKVHSLQVPSFIANEEYLRTYGIKYKAFAQKKDEGTSFPHTVAAAATPHNPNPPLPYRLFAALHHHRSSNPSRPPQASAPR